MKSRFLLLMIFSTLLLTGCSIDNDEDLTTESSSSELVLDDVNSEMATRPFKSRAFGEWYWTESNNCGGLLQYTITGTGNATHMGLISVDGTLCTYPPQGIYFITVKYTAANGDYVLLESEEVFLNEDGLFAGGIFNFTDGSGRFNEVQGSVEVDEVLLVTEIDPITGIPLAGTFSNKSLGTIMY